MNVIDKFDDNNAFLSNFVYVPGGIWIPNETFRYRDVERAYQASKTFNIEQRIEIRDAATPGKAKRLGRLVTIRSDWDEIKIDVMTDLLCQKFTYPEFKQRLIDTGDAVLIEGNTWNDTFWGMCKGLGENNLGKILMIIRSNLLEMRNNNDC